jgi:hypothetical protein
MIALAMLREGMFFERLIAPPVRPNFMSTLSIAEKGVAVFFEFFDD